MVDWAKRVEQLEALLNVALARIVELEDKLGLSSGNSSKSPSSDMGRKRKPPVEPSGRKPDGQPGHKGQTRDQVPPNEVDATEDVDPQACENCGEDLGAQPRLGACIRQVTATPEFKAFVLEFSLWSKTCQSADEPPRQGCRRARRRVPLAREKPNSIEFQVCRWSVDDGWNLVSVGFENCLWAPTTRASGGPEAIFKSNEQPARSEGRERLPWFKPRRVLCGSRPASTGTTPPPARTPAGIP